MAGRRHLLAARRRQFPSFFRALAQHHHSQKNTPTWKLAKTSPESFGRARHNSPHRLVVRMSRGGRDNPGSTPGVDIVPHSFFWSPRERFLDTAVLLHAALCWQADNDQKTVLTIACNQQIGDPPEHLAGRGSGVQANPL